jgi:hypothetical protein
MAETLCREVVVEVTDAKIEKTVVIEGAEIQLVIGLS